MKEMTQTLPVATYLHTELVPVAVRKSLALFLFQHLPKIPPC